MAPWVAQKPSYHFPMSRYVTITTRVQQKLPDFGTHFLEQQRGPRPLSMQYTSPKVLGALRRE
uniref:Uncharacterized protein n=1 Tax=Romanomermis culicivorax TaxID=13658 RepID=A0A915KRI4_ROMCU